VLTPQSDVSMDVSNLSLQAPRHSSVDEERMREKAREAQEQAAAAQANLENATQQARVAAINAAATQAALGTAAQAEKQAPATTLRKTAGRYALADFAIERTWVPLSHG
jgi:protein kinase A